MQTSWIIPVDTEKVYDVLKAVKDNALVNWVNSRDKKGNSKMQKGEIVYLYDIKSKILILKAVCDINLYVATADKLTDYTYWRIDRKPVVDTLNAAFEDGMFIRLSNFISLDKYNITFDKLKENGLKVTTSLRSMQGVSYNLNQYLKSVLV